MRTNSHSRIRWGLVALAAVLSEVTVVAVLGAVIGAHRLVIAPGLTEAEYAAFSALASYYVAPATAGVATFLGALWIGRKLQSAFVENGTLVGVFAVALTFGFIFVANPDDRLMYGVSFVLRVIGGYLGGVVVRRTRERAHLSTVSGSRKELT